MNYRFYFNFRRVNEINRPDFVIHCNTCRCGEGMSNQNGFWSDWFVSYEDAHNVIMRLIDEFRDHDYVVRPCNECQ
jgi:hypothetical protein